MKKYSQACRDMSMAAPLGAHGQSSTFHFRQMLLKQKKKQQQMICCKSMLTMHKRASATATSLRGDGEERGGK
jgi:hypothetical protein